MVLIFFELSDSKELLIVEVTPMATKKKQLHWEILSIFSGQTVLTLIWSKYPSCGKHTA